MKILADMGVSIRTVESLRGSGHDVEHLRERGLERLEDSAILDLARAEGRVVLTFDLDFADLAAASSEHLPSVVILRLRNETPTNVTALLTALLPRIDSELETGAVVSVDDARYRVRHLPIS